jgi:hypothetical protein
MENLMINQLKCVNSHHLIKFSENDESTSY